MLFKPPQVDTLIPIRCPASGNQDFSLYEAHYRARSAILNGSAEYTLVLDDGQIVAKFQRAPLGDGVIQTLGPEIL